MLCEWLFFARGTGKLPRARCCCTNVGSTVVIVPPSIHKNVLFRFLCSCWLAFQSASKPTRVLEARFLCSLSAFLGHTFVVPCFSYLTRTRRFVSVLSVITVRCSSTGSLLISSIVRRFFCFTRHFSKSCVGLVFIDHPLNCLLLVGIVSCHELLIVPSRSVGMIVRLCCTLGPDFELTDLPTFQPSH